MAALTVFVLVITGLILIGLIQAAPLGHHPSQPSTDVLTDGVISDFVTDKDKERSNNSVFGYGYYVRKSEDAHKVGRNGSEESAESMDLAESGDAENETHHTINVIKLKYDYVQNPLLITVFLLAICILKIGFEHCHRLNQAIPESCMLILLGLGIGFLLLEKNATSELAFLRFSAQSFFLFLLPPIILEAAYSLKDRAFADNLGTIMLYAILGTILNVVIVGPALYGFYKLGIMGASWHVTFFECLMFSVIVAAVDPVAVLAIFQNMGVNKLLYFIVFGESLFNDGVTVVLYNMIIDFLEIDQIGAKELGLGLAAFLCVCVGATAIGLFMGFTCAFITKYTAKIQTAEPFLLYGFAYLSYLLAELFDFSGILSSLSESLIFIILAVMAINVRQAWLDFNIGFAVLAVILCIVSRFIVTYGLAFCVNRLLLGIRKIGVRDQFVMAYGGLRGAITFSLAFSLNHELLLEKEKTQHVLLTSAYVVIFFTTFLQGITMKPLVKLLQVRLQEEEDSLFGEINLAILGNMSAAIEQIVGAKGNHYWSAMSKYLSRRFLRPLVNKYPDKKYTSMVAAYQHAQMQSVYSVDESTGMTDISISIPRTDTYWRSLEHFDNTQMPNAVSESALDMHDSYRRRMRMRPNGVENGIVKPDVAAVPEQPVRGQTPLDQFGFGALSVKIDVESPQITITRTASKKRQKSSQSLADIFHEGQSRNMDARRASLLLTVTDPSTSVRAHQRRRSSTLANTILEGHSRNIESRRIQNAINKEGNDNKGFAESNEDGNTRF